MLKVMVFIDGTWLYANTAKLSEAYGDSSFKVDFGKLPVVLAQELAESLVNLEVDLVRTYLFGSYAANYDPRDEDAVARRKDFFDMLKEEYHYEVETYPVNFSGRRIRRSDRDPGDPFEPREKYVDIALATAMLYYAALPHAYDIAIAVIGDRDFVPMLQGVRRLGKRVALASIKGSCASELFDPRDESRVKDFDLIWLDNLLPRLEFKYERVQRRCESPTHRGNPLVWTTYRPRKGERFFCEECRQEFRQQRDEALRAAAEPPAPLQEAAPTATASPPAPPLPEAAPTATASPPDLPDPEPALPPADLYVPFVPSAPPQPAPLRGSAGASEALPSRLPNPLYPPRPIPAAPRLSGYIKRLIPEKVFGFIAGSNGNDYFFHISDLMDLDYDSLDEGMPIEFEIKREPSDDRAGAAQNVRRVRVTA